MTTIEIFQRLSIALAIGLLIGLERGWRARVEKEGERAAGLRTFALSSLLGGVWGIVAARAGGVGLIAVAVVFAVFSVLIALFRLREMRHDGSFGATTIVAAMLAFSLGVFAAFGDMLAAAAAGIATTLLLALKGGLHAWVKRLTWEELRSGLVLLAMTFIALPILPDRGMGPLKALNPHELWVMTILIAALSFAGYVAIKLTGERLGIIMAAAAGGLVSSTATTLAMARFAKSDPAQSPLFAGGALIAGLVMILRIIALTVFFDAAVLPLLLPALVPAAAVVAAVAGVSLLGRSAATPSPLELTSPFELATVLRFGALLAGVILVVAVAKSYGGAGGVMALAAISGLVDVDSITLALLRGEAAGINQATAAAAILVAAAVNTLSKAGLAWVSGGRHVGLRLAITGVLAVLAGGAGYLWLPPAA
ncbi:MAG: DUF4010 domain-containing protein [Hyphomicrobiaceae bacterium]|nr:DUF4010 domain-containing protein [Hyphomicrobiaceae bacterium]